MATVEQVATASFNWILERDAALPLSVKEGEDYIFILNNYMLGLDAENITLGFTIVSSLEDTVTVPGGALRGVIANMAVELASSYSYEVGSRLDQVAADSLLQMRMLGQTIGDTRYPSTLPLGSGNENDTGDLLFSHFYWEGEAVILAESTGSIGLESSTEEAISND